MQPQKLCLKWNNHTANLLSVLGGFQQRDILVDVTISCEGQNIKAHKMVLSACSPYFQNIFLENPCQHPIVIINGFKYEDITAILNFMYKGEVNVSQDGLTSFLQAAEALKVKGLAEVCGEKRSTNSSSQEVQQSEPQPQNRPQRTETPPRKRHRNRKRSLSDSNRSDDEGSSRKQHREPSSPEVHELSGDESFTGDTNSNGPPFNSTPRVPQNVYSRSHQSSSNIAEDDDEFEVEPSKLLEQTLTTDNVSMNSSSVDNNKLRIERIMGNAEMESSSLQEPESPPDIKPIIDYGDSSAGPSEGSMMLYNEQSQPGPSSLQDGSLLHDNAHTQDIYGVKATSRSNNSSNPKSFNGSSHIFETTHFLRELDQDPMCVYDLDDDFGDISNAGELNGFLQKDNSKGPKKSKQLLIYNEKGCMKSIEVEKEINSGGVSLYSSPLKETYLLVEDIFSNNTPKPKKSVSFQFEPNQTKYSNDATKSDATENMNFQQSYPPHTAKSTQKKCKGKRGRKKGQSYKSKHTTTTTTSSTSDSNLQGGSECPRSCAVQSYTQVSVEEVHLAESGMSPKRPRRNSKKRSVSEMLMLKRKIKRKIVQSTSIEYQSDEFHKSCSSMNTGLSHSYNSHTRNVTKQHNDKALVPYRLSRIPNEMEKYGPELLPPGWNTEIVTRKTGKSAGNIDVYFVNPEGKRIRSKAQMAKYLVENNLPYCPDEFIFRKSAYLMLQN